MRITFHDHFRRPLNAMGVVLLLTLLGATPAAADFQSLATAFADAPAGSGYDTLLVMDPADTYTGGLTLPAGNHCIVGNGAVVNLQGYSVSAGSGVILDVSGVSFIGGSYGINFNTGSMGYVERCNFIDNTDGLRAWEGAAVTLVSCNFVDNSHYGVYRHEHGSIFNVYNNAWNNGVWDFVYFCPG